MYAKDLSKKVKSAKRQRALNGLFISAQAPYGYIKGPTNNNHLIVDEDIRHVIELIFNLCVGGKGTPLIAKELESRKILNPSAYKTLKGSTRFNRYKESNPYKWKAITVRKILTDMVYCGHMENGKYKIENYKTKKRIRVPDNEHIIVKNTHEAIISESTFKTAKTVLEARHYPAHYEHENLFKSIIFCECGKRMVIAHKTRNDKTTSFYKCPNHEINPDFCPKSNIVNYDDLKNVIDNELKLIFGRIKNGDTFFEIFSKKINSEMIKDNKPEIVRLKSRIEKLIKIASKLYEDYSNDLINDITYRELISKNRKEQDLLIQKIEALENTNNMIKLKNLNLNQLKLEFDKFLDKVELTKEMVNSLIERIEVGYTNKNDDGFKEKKVKIVYKFIEASLT